MSTLYADLPETKIHATNESVVVHTSELQSGVQQKVQQLPESHVRAAEYCRLVPSLDGSMNCREVLGILKEQPDTPCMVICEEGNKPTGLVMRDAFYRRLAGRFAADLYFSRSVHQFADMEALMMDIQEDPRIIIQYALDRVEAKFYDCVILTDHGELAGVVTVQDLMIMSGLLQAEAEKLRKHAVSENYRHVDGIEQSLRQVAEAANITLKECEQMKEWSVNGRTTLDEACLSYSKVAQNMNSNQQQVSKLIEDIEKISLLTKNITELADKSGLLAINASIEAAHAGEHGRGFQVVAKEVRSLASQTRQLAADISGFLGSISHLARETGSLTSSGVSEIQASAIHLAAGSRMFGEMEQAVLLVESTGASVSRLAGGTAKQAADVKKELELSN